MLAVKRSGRPNRASAPRHVKGSQGLKIKKEKMERRRVKKILKNKKATTLLMLTATLMFLAVFAATIAKAEENLQTARIWTDKADYAPEETVTIYGTGFLPESPVTVKVTRPDSAVDSWDVVSDSDGSFTTTYLLNGIIGEYTVVATDGTNTATTTFTDGLNVRLVWSTDSGGVSKTSFFTNEDVYAMISISWST